MKKFSLVVAISAVLCFLGANPEAYATNYFNWNCETSSTSLGPVVSWGSGTSLNSTTAHTGTNSMKLAVIGNDGNNQQMGAEVGNKSFGLNVIGSKAIYYRWWMRINSGFSWGNSTAKTKSSRMLTSSSPKYTGYVSKTGITIGECTDQAGCLAQGGASNSSDAAIKINYDFQAAADSQWHEYIVMVKPNTSTSSLDAQLSLYVDGQLKGTYNNYKLTNSNYAMNEAWGGWMVRPYFQMGGTSSDGGTIYVDDFSTDDAWNSTFAPNTTATLAAPSNLRIN